MCIPTVGDFTRTKASEDDVHGLSAWEHFGNLSLEQAYAKFCEGAEALQEDFMWMGDRAFSFYFPVVDRYIREEESKCEFDGETYVLAHDIGMHIPIEAPEVRSLERHILSLCDFVLDRVGRLKEEEGRSHPVHEVASVWRDLRARIESSSSPPAQEDGTVP